MFGVTGCWVSAQALDSRAPRQAGNSPPASPRLRFAKSDIFRFAERGFPRRFDRVSSGLWSASTRAHTRFREFDPTAVLVDVRAGVYTSGWIWSLGSNGVSRS
jgi:hypothetical protein